MDKQVRLEDQAVVEALRLAGVNVTSAQDLMRRREPYPRAIPVLLDMLGKVETYTMKEIIVRSLGTKEAKGKVEEALMEEFESSLDSENVEGNSFRWAIANTLEIIGGKGDVETFLHLLCDPRSGGARGMLSLAAAKTKDRRLIPILLENLDTDDFLGFAARGLGILRAEEAIPKLKELAGRTKNSWVRREALTALRRMGVEADSIIQAAVTKTNRSAKPKRESRGSGDASLPEKKVAEVPNGGPLDEQLRSLAECGIRLSPTFTPWLLSMKASGQATEKDSYRLLLCALGEEVEVGLEAEHAGYLSDNIWHFDTECIEDHGSYAAIAERMAVLAQGDLPLQSVEDYVDLEAGEARLSFTLEGQSYKWIARVDDDWVDPSIFSRFADLLASRKTGKRFTYIDLEGQDCLIGCATPEQRECLEARTGLKVEWLS